MDIKKIDSDCFLVYCCDGVLDIYDLKMVKNKVSEIVKNLINNYEISGCWKVNIYIGHNDDWLVEFEKIEDKDIIDIKLNFVIEETFFRMIDYFDNILNNDIIYYYDNHFFIKTDNLGIDVIYGDISKLILDKGIKIRN